LNVSQLEALDAEKQAGGGIPAGFSGLKKGKNGAPGGARHFSADNYYSVLISICQ
jgi:hypothetical protein